ncbi:hypothetical protein TTHT_0682 [Thermotomaculum hydrothermale]|uniref:DUF2232 domain-containing protein n=1 Tax=Thermotomaculum hydrothermale TaxID=981385 RepID=A0A7R6PEH5_9BACT|nr:DUF2232 domain-containing protein [Thermotomaculum hydrothermale]BBB32254.1 hypothetical protein TTHT_0682 [Thermotomaculum hydrothermale]
MKKLLKDYFLFVLVLIILNFSGPLAIFLPLPFFLYKDKFSFKTLFFTSLIPLFFIFPFLPDKLSIFASVLHYGSLVLPTLLIIYIHRKFTLTPFLRIVIPTLTILIFIVSITYFFITIEGKTVFEQIFEQFFKTANLNAGDLEYVKNVFKYAGLGLIFFSEAIFFLFNTLFFGKIGGVLRDFYDYRVNITIVLFTVLFLIVVNILWATGNLNGIVLQIISTISFFLFFIFFVQGFAIYLFFLKKVGFSGFAKALSIVLIFIYPLPAMLSLAGILDFWVDFRKKIKNIGGGKVV